MCASSREGDDFPVTDDKTGTAELLAWTEMDVRTVFYVHMDDPRRGGQNDLNSVEQQRQSVSACAVELLQVWDIFKDSPVDA